MRRFDSVRYPALIDGENGAYGVSFPDLPGIVAMGDTIEEALMNAEEALRDYVIETEKDGGEIVQPCEPDEGVGVRLEVVWVTVNR